MHNLAGETHLCSKFQDDVEMNRKIFTTAEKEEPPFNDNMRDA